MEPLAIVTPIINLVKNFFLWILRKFGYKIVELNNFKEETVEVDFNYPIESTKAINETKQGAKFYWSAQYRSDYEKYFEIEGNIRRYFKCRNAILWIKRQINN